MQHPPELKTKFLELRARGLSYGQIAETIGVSKPTLIQWGKSMAEEIADLQAAERELVREKLLGNFEQWLGRQVHHFNRLDEEFGRREFKYSPTESVFRMMMASRKVLDRYFFDDDKPSRRGARTSSSATTQATQEFLLPRGEGQDEGQTGSPQVALPRAVETQPLGEIKSSKPPADSARMEMQNQTFSGPFLDQKEGSSTSAAPHNHTPSASSPAGVDTTELPNQQSDTDSGENSVAGKFIAALHRLESAETDSLTESTALRADSAGSQSEIPNPKSEVESAFAPSRPCVEPSTASAEAQNPAKTQPFTSQNSGPHKPNLSTVADEGRAMCPHSAVPLNPNLAPGSEREVPLGQSAEDIGNPQPGIQNAEPESGLEGESIPIGPYESTREWLERQGIRVPRRTDLPIVTKSNEGLPSRNAQKADTINGSLTPVRF